MPTFLTPEQKAELERLVDASTLRAVAIALSEIAAEKAEHIETNWQDRITARTWRDASRRLDRAAGSMVT